jgi:hypothetical protein
MTTIEYIRNVVYPAAFQLLPLEMDSAPARAMLTAIGLQESRFMFRRQMGGPALSFWQGEATGGLVGLAKHPRTRDLVREILSTMAYGQPDITDFQAIEDNDILACCGARLLLWTHPGKLPTRSDRDDGWRQYLELWRPGKPHPEAWNENWLLAWRDQ